MNALLPTSLPLTIQDLSPESAHLCLRVRDFIKDILKINLQNCVVGVSGGADSVALVLILHYLKINVHIAHLDHGLRVQSKHEAKFVTVLAQMLNKPCIVKHESVEQMAIKNGIGLEEAGRIARYEFFEQVRAEQGLDYIAAGHQLNDLSEDILLRLIRGSGWPGLGGMKAIDENRHLIRPLLSIQRQELEDFLNSLHINWCIDESNEHLDFKRNRIRHLLMPLLQIENPSIDQAMYNLWQQARLDEDYFNLKLSHLDDTDNLLQAAELKKLPKALRLRSYYKMIKKLSPNTQVRFESLLKLDQAWENKRSGSIIQLKSMHIKVSKAGLHFSQC